MWCLLWHNMQKTTRVHLAAAVAVSCQQPAPVLFQNAQKFLELELILTKILESELELNPKNEAGIGIRINSIFLGITNGLVIWVH